MTYDEPTEPKVSGHVGRAPRKAWADSKRVVPADWWRRRQACLRDHHGICHLCGHGGADQADHLVPVARGGDHEPGNLRPVHGRPCPTCGVRCHDDKTKREAADGRRLKGRRRPDVEPHPGAR